MSKVRHLTPSPRPSIFDVLEEKYPDLAAEPASEPAPRASRRRAPLILAVLALLGAGGLSLVWRSDRPGVEPPDRIEPAALGPAGSSSLRIAAAQAPDVPESEPAPPPRQPDPAARASRVPRVSEGPVAPSPKPKVHRKAAAAKKPEPPKAEIPKTDTPQQPAVKVLAPQPEYPDAARAAGLSGTVVAEAVIDPAGAVSETRVLRGIAPELDQAALDALGRWRFEPATRHGEPVADTYRVAFRFAFEPRPEPTAAPVDGDVVPPVKLYSPSPPYPQADWVAAVAGDVTLRATVNEQGRVAAVEVVQGLSPRLDELAAQALARWRFRPATRLGVPTAAEHVVTFRFSR